MRDRCGDAGLSRSIGIETAASDTEFDVNLYRTASRIDRWGPFSIRRSSWFPPITAGTVGETAAPSRSEMASDGSRVQTELPTSDEWSPSLLQLPLLVPSATFVIAAPRIPIVIATISV